MQEKRTPIFQNKDGSWGHVTQTVNPLICTIEYSYNTGFPSKKGSREKLPEIPGGLFQPDPTAEKVPEDPVYLF